MRYILKGYQEVASEKLLAELARAHHAHATTGELRAVSLQAPTGAGKTVIAASVIEALLDGDGGPEDDDQAIVLWLTTDPNLNAQTKTKMLTAASGLMKSQLQVIGNDFDARTFTPGNVYFLNTQKLARGTRLDTGATDARTHSLWETIANTSREWGRHFYVVIDEAHVGVGGSSDATAPTITRRIIDGAASGPKVPVVVGITATPRKFERAMRTAGRTLVPVEVPIADVQASGLIKDGIILLAPNSKLKGLEYELIRRAGRRLEDYRQNWAAHTTATGEPDVNPAMIVQLADTPTKAVLAATLAALRASIPGLTEDEIVHTFAEHAALEVSGWKISHRSPELISIETNLKVILAKSAITTGWDCPRAEVMVSLRKVEDADLIAQIVGRTVRTPLAKRIEGNDRLNSVVAYLPFFNTVGLGAVAAALTPAADETHAETSLAGVEVETAEIEFPDFGGEYPYEDDNDSTVFHDPAGPGDGTAPRVDQASQNAPVPVGTVNKPLTARGTLGGASAPLGTATQVLDDPAPAPSPVSMQPQLDEDAREELGVFQEMTSAGFADLTVSTPEREDGPAYYEIEPACPQVVLDAIRALPSYKLTERSAAAATKRLMELAVKLEQYGAATDAQTRSIRALYREMADHRERRKAEGAWDVALDAAEQLTLIGRMVDAHGAGDAVAKETMMLSSDVVTERFRKAQKALAEQMGINYLRLASEERPDEDKNDIRIEVIALAADEELRQALEYRAAKVARDLADDHAAAVSRLPTGPRTEIEELMAALRTVVQVPTAIPVSVRDIPGSEWLEKHVLSSGGRFRYKANPLESRVLEREISHYAGWFRNPSTATSPGLSIHCEDMSGADRILRPDFVFVSEDGRAAIVDPHSGHLADGVWKARGLARYAAANKALVDRALVIDEIAGEDKYLDLLDEAVAAALETATDISAVYRDHGRRHA
ncbi:DEAD/DEAH box helicase [Kocuria rosea]|uniref:Helicase ATP-binding domain-containing protein n=1 Tax=Kocuria rosea TaxID=1275 RepID=A0A4R5YCB1_KOCRO|nr:DEAD/DEAH box helicase family protein [Kocuria rosea]TDL42482.1 hypothetical protein E2R59_11085 [Kocuria rosea]